jgi:2,5-diamino-6-(ribosylamino)-4(3H)-pyrimidinone 5'-phosphate reductase
VLPRVIIHNEISLDGRMDRLDVDMERFYGLAATWKEDVTLVGSDTLLAGMPELATAPDSGPAPAAAVASGSDAASGPPGTPHQTADQPPADAASAPKSTAPLLAAVDGRGRLPGLAALRNQPYWSDVVALCSNAAPAEYLGALSRHGVDHLVCGADRVDLRAALEWLAERYGARVVRVDAGGTLIGALLRAGLVDEVSVLVEPRMIGGTSPKWLFQAPDTATDDDCLRLRLQHLERFDDDAIWLRYEVLGRS